MTELLEPAPMLDDGEEFGGPIRHTDETDPNFNDNADSDIDPNFNGESDDEFNIDIDERPKEDAIHIPQPHIANESSGNALLESSVPQQARKSQPKMATSAGMVIGEQTEAQESIDSNESKQRWEEKGHHNVKPNSIRSGNKACCADFYARLYSYPRLRIFLSFLYLLVSLILVCGDIFGALFIGNEMWTFRYKYANTEYHELWFATLLVLVCSPFCVLWAAHLIFIEESIGSIRSSSGGYCACAGVKYALMFLYLLTPIGVCGLLIYEFVYIYVYQMVIMLFYRFLCSKPSSKMITNIKKTKGSRSYLRFRKLSHMLSSSIPLMMFYGFLYYFDPYPRLKWKYLLGTTFVSGLNSLFTILSFSTDSSSLNIRFSEYFVLSLRLFGGFVPKLGLIQNGSIRRINYCTFAFGNYSYAQFADVIESGSSQLETIIINRSTLSDLSLSLCYQLGAVCSAKNINIMILKNYSPFVVWKYLFPSQFKYRVTLSQFREAMRSCDIFNDVAESQFDELEMEFETFYGTHNSDKFYYFCDFVQDWNGFDRNRGIFDALLRILPSHIVDKTNKHTNMNGKVDERLLNLILGTGKINEIDPNNQTSALFYAIVQNDYDLIDRLCNNGANISTKDEWQRMGEFINQLVKDNNMDDLSLLIATIKGKKGIDIDLTYHDMDGRNALMYAAINGNMQTAELLTKCGLGVDILHMDQDGNTAADLAKQHNHPQVEQYLKHQFL